jgi:hypothetical protein
MTALSRTVTPLPTYPIYALVRKQVIGSLSRQAGALRHQPVTVGGCTEVCGNSSVTTPFKWSDSERAYNLCCFF